MPINGTSGDDLLNGTSGNDTINGLAGSDTLNGGFGNDVLNGGDDNDLLLGGGGGGFDILNGENGDDTLRPIDQPDPSFSLLFFQLDGGSGVDKAVLIGDFFTITPVTESSPGSLTFKSFSSGLYQYDLFNIEIVELLDDNLNHYRSIELVLGAAGADALSAGVYAFGAYIHGGSGNDTLTGGAYDDELFGGFDDDQLSAGAGNDALTGGDGFDTLTGGAGADAFIFENWTDFSGAGDVITDLETADHISFFIPGENFAGVFIGEAAFGGSGREIRVVKSGGNTVIQFDTDGDAIADSTLTITNGEFSLRTAHDFFTELEIAVINPSTAGNDDIRGSIDANNLNGIDGNDSINGELGDDVISGGAGNDTLIGGAGADTISGGQGIDVFRWHSTLHLSASGEIITDLDALDSIDFQYIFNFQGEIGGLDISWIGGNAFSGVAGQYRYQKSGGQTQIEFDLDGDSIADRTVTITNGAFDLWLWGSAKIRIVSGPATLGADSLSGTNGADSINGLNGDDFIIGLVGADTLIGGGGNDTLYGDQQDDFIQGGVGADLLDGSFGSGDILSYQGSSAGVSVNLETNTASGGDAAGDTISGFEQVNGSSHNDTLTGSDSVDNYLRGSVGNDSLTGLSGKDTLDGGAGNDTLIGGDNPDILVGGAGADVINGGASIDKADYTKASAGVNVNLSTGGISGIAAGDTYSSIEIVSGSNFGDTLTGGNSGDDIRGRGGSDIISGGNGNDKLLGYSGNDTLIGGAGNDTLTGGGHNDHFVFSGDFGDDVIADINAGALIRDVIEINGFGPSFDSFAEILAATTDVGGNAVIDINGNTITLMGVTKAQLDANDFSFT